MHASLLRLASLPDELTVLPGHDYGPSPSNKIGGEKATNMMMREAMMRASPAEFEFAASLRNLSAPSLVHTAEDARRRWRRRGPTGSNVQAVTAACCAVYAGAGAGVARAREEGGGGGVRPFLLHGSGARGAAARHGHALAKLMSARPAYYVVQ
jgi:hypothetical protein